MLLTKLLLAASLFGIIFTIRCYSGMQGYVDDNLIERMEIQDCNGTDFCVKLPSNGHVGRKKYEGAAYSCDDFGECRKEGCSRRAEGGTICCCLTDECNGSNFHNLYLVFITIILAILLKI